MDTVRIVRDENGRNWINVNQKEVQRSMISSTYANRFIREYILKEES